MTSFWLFLCLIILAFSSRYCSALPKETHEFEDIEVDISNDGIVNLSPPTISLDSVSHQNQWASISRSTKISSDASNSNVIIEDRGQGRRVKFTLPNGYKLPSAALSGPRPPGTLLLNMLTKNERDHLDRVLPQWAPVIDCWVIGVDRHNTDDSEAVILRHLGHLPGRVVVVDFDGMGPTWTELVKVGYNEFPQCTHGIVADADFAPRGGLDKRQLDVRCSKHMYTIWTQDLANARKMDWIYRNVPGAHVSRRTHQIVEVPSLPAQEVYQTLVDLHVVEREGGYQDRTPGKMERYLGFLEGDLAELPGDPRSLYYVGYAYYDLFSQTSRAWERLPARDKTQSPAARRPLAAADWRAFVPTDAAPGAPHTATLNGAALRVAPLARNHRLAVAFQSLPRLPESAADLAHVPAAWLRLPDGNPARYGDVLNAYRWMYLEMAVRFFVLRAHSAVLHVPDALLDAAPAAAPAAGVHSAAASRNELVAGEGNAEERWFAMLKLGEIFERFYAQWPVAEHWYNACVRLDRERADAFFYVGQHYRLHGDHARAAAVLQHAAQLPMPQRSLFQWFSLYQCVAPLELARAVVGMGAREEPRPAAKHADDADFMVGRDSARLGMSAALVRSVHGRLSTADCSHDQHDAQQQAQLLQELTNKLRMQEVSSPSATESVRAYHLGRVEPLRELLRQVGNHEHDLRESLSRLSLTGVVVSQTQGDISVFDLLQQSLEPIRMYLKQYSAIYQRHKSDHSKQTEDAVIQFVKKCKTFRNASSALLRFWKSHHDVFKSELPAERYADITQTISSIKHVCR